LKSRRRRLRYFNVGTPQFAAQMAMTACVLHNICQLHDDEAFQVDDDDDDNDDTEIDDSQSVTYTLASRKRDAIADSY